MSRHSDLAPGSAARADQRTYMRIKTAISGKLFFPSKSDETDCVVTDISLGGASIECAEAPAVGMEVVLFATGFDRFAGTVVRSTPDGVAIRFDVTNSRERIAEKIMLYLGEHLSAATQTRRFERIPVPPERRFMCQNGEAADFEIVDISLGGASLKSEVRPPIGELVTIGATMGRVTRHIGQGVAVEFVARS